MKRTPTEELRVERVGFQITTRNHADKEDRDFWLQQPPQARLRHVELLRRLNYGPEVTDQGLQRVFAVLERKGR